MERNIGEKFQVGEDWYKIVPQMNDIDDRCFNCSISSKTACKMAGVCFDAHRSDRRNVIAVRCEPPGVEIENPKLNDTHTAPKNNVHEGKSKPTLLPLDVLMKYLAPAYEEGVIKYERESWRQGFHTSVLVDAALRHIIEFYWYNKDIDSDSVTGKHHLAGAIFSLLSILHTLDTRPDLDDRFTQE